MHSSTADTALTPSPPHAAHGDVHLGHVMPLWLLAAVFLTLVALTGLTVLAAQFDLGNMNLYVALAIAATKASLVVLFFMHLLWDRPFNSMIFVGCLMFVTLFIGVSLTDCKANHPSATPGQGSAMEKVHTPLDAPQAGAPGGGSTAP